MFRKLLYITCILLFTSCLLSQNKPPQPGLDNPLSALSDINRTNIIEYAKSHLGTRYLYAGIDPAKGFDCSGFVYFVFKKFNIDLPRGSGEYKNLGQTLNPEEFRVGDILVFYGYADHTRIGHVGIICEANGMKSRFIHSSSGKANGVIISELGSELYTRRFYKCIDVIH